jgi:AmiR/NasT family two-component response regulator
MLPDPSLKILIAEDDFLVVEMVKGLLRELGHTLVGHAVNGKEAVEMVRQLSPDVVLMDIKMPVMDGIEATRLIQQECPTPVVVVTAHESPGLVNQVSQAGAGAYLVKPPLASEIDRAIKVARARFEDMFELRRLNRELADRNQELEQALEQIQTLRGLIPICAECKKIRDDEGYWQQVEVYLQEHTQANFSHGLCPECAARLYPDIYPKKD